MRGRTNIILQKITDNGDTNVGYTQSTSLRYDSYEYTKNSDGCYNVSWNYIIPSTTNYVFVHTVLPCCTSKDGVISILIDGIDVTDDIVVDSENSHEVFICDISGHNLLGYRLDKLFCLRKQDLKNFSVYGQEFNLTIKFENLYCSGTNIENIFSTNGYYKNVYVHDGTDEELDETETLISSTTLTPDFAPEDDNYYYITYTIPSNIESIMIREEIYANIGTLTQCLMFINGNRVTNCDFVMANPVENSLCTIDGYNYGYSFSGKYMNKQFLKYHGVYGQEFTLTLAVYKYTVESAEQITPTIYLFTKETAKNSFDVYLCGPSGGSSGYARNGTFFYINSSLYSHIKIEGNFYYGTTNNSYTSVSNMTFVNYRDNDTIIQKSTNRNAKLTESVDYESDIVQSTSESTYPTYIKIGYAEGYTSTNTTYAISSFEGTITLTPR